MASGRVNRANKAEHMAAPHRICDVKIFLANSEPSTHGPCQKSFCLHLTAGYGLKADFDRLINPNATPTLRELALKGEGTYQS